TDLYAAFLRRTPDQAGLTTFVTALERGTALEEVAAAILSSEEYLTKQCVASTAGFVAALYRDVLGRAFDQQGGDHFLHALNEGAAPADVARVVLESEEARHLLVGGLYQQLLGREGEAGGLQRWRDRLLHGQTPYQVVAGF